VAKKSEGEKEGQGVAATSAANRANNGLR